MISFRIALYMTAIFAIAIALGTLTPLPEKVDVPGTDKWQHFVAFAILTLPLSITNPSRWWLIAPIALLFGATIEVVQPFVNRYGDFGDFKADAIGVGLGAISSFALTKVTPSINRK